MNPLRNSEQLEQAVLRYGFFPFFDCGVAGLSIEANTPRELWFTDLEGPWEWRMEVAKNRRCAYGKFFGSKAGFVSLELLPDFINYRRDGYDFDARWDDGLVRQKDKTVFDAIQHHGPITSRELRAACGYSHGSGGFEGIITRLQMQGYVFISDFARARNRKGQEYGWAVSVFATPEQIFGERLVTSAYHKTPQQSFESICRHLKTTLPGADEKKIQTLLK